ncbi:MAG: hypothetical protein UV64_C0001G0004 [Parcubacteria group bacterium GW2011_GWC1_43_11b]|uniref:Uncharacterized protein n=2 Tax=Candidatus Vogeliibacteriota TaxID=1817922 RepID=A0A1G2QFB5_9BACT|nr:MAG: hypothetical protein UV50_C0008G0030 [Parcubacteria group bacterium GW2011_GWB1_42_9]KKS89745.1 MAG: hypothetical protein UV64_C0001G0004 [Parcubacteria group bacterium GW2011_GWC1_43_11b]KKT09657.1 MAG: hypothetical protein UV88_C0006G0008 [Parcubacteria group bacterium GW2011_GWA1_43_21]OHA58710.1 MAG: hypothetical protein A2607_01405 [Candidatus Vogelbacteria bacterium RIFOXYD1_FULL_42_15]OHA59294.1 MAG: hypothetical protein A2370_01965 [Candidatus Vogelbacteria bacterium RIFOXYB1_FU
MKITRELIKIFIDWTKLKIRVHALDRPNVIFPKKKEIWWASLGQNIGVEINGKNDNFERPVLIIKVFNNESVLVVPISSTIKVSKYNINFINDRKENSVIISQIKMVSTKRLLRLVAEMEDFNFDKILVAIKKFF